MKKILSEHKHFFALLSVFWIGGILLVVLTDKAELHLFFNKKNSPLGDTLFPYITYLGDGLLIGITAILLLFYKLRYGFALGTAGILTALFVQILKRQVFASVYRPKKFFAETIGNDTLLHFVSGHEPGSMFSFPSGHTTAAFALFIFLILISKHKALQALFLIFAFAAAYSRIYLSWHFFEDILAGSFLGTIIALFSYLIFRKIKAPFMNENLITIFKKTSETDNPKK